MGRSIETHVSQGLFVRTFQYDTCDNRPCDYQLQYGTENGAIKVIRSIQEFENDLIVILRRTFSQGEYHASVRHSLQSGEWRVNLEHQKMLIGSVVYSSQGYLRSAHIVDDSAKFTLVRTQTPPFTIVPVFFNDFPNLYRHEPSALDNHQAEIHYQERHTTFVANWDDPEQVSLVSTNQHTKDKKSMVFPTYLPVQKSNILHQHLEKAHFPFELIHILASGETK